MMLIVGVVTIDLGREDTMMATDLVIHSDLGEVRTHVGTVVVSMMTMIRVKIDLEEAIAKVLVNQGTISMITNNERSIGTKKLANTTIQMILVMTVKHLVGVDRRAPTLAITDNRNMVISLIVTETGKSVIEMDTTKDRVVIEMMT